jgi:hypothetical protein
MIKDLAFGEQHAIAVATTSHANRARLILKSKADIVIKRAKTINVGSGGDEHERGVAERPGEQTRGKCSTGETVSLYVTEGLTEEEWI